jgi:hypothetical protein
MKNPIVLPAFSRKEFVKAHFFLASRVATMMRRKFEEGDWSQVYCAAKNIPHSGWSNLKIDVMHKGLGVEHKMLCVKSDKNIRDYCGTSLMHPSATRSIRVPSTQGDPTEMAAEVLSQYAQLIEERRQKVAEAAPGNEADMRVGWLLWQESLREFLYFEEEMLPPKPDDYTAEWKESGGGARKTSRNLWVYEKETGRKRFSITTSAGAKIQPYFDVPSPTSPGLYYFCVQGEKLKGGVVRVWITPTTAMLLKRVIGSLDTETLSKAIISASQEASAVEGEEAEEEKIHLAESVLITPDAYSALTETFAGVSDEHRIQLFIRRLLT